MNQSSGNHPQPPRPPGDDSRQNGGGGGGGGGEYYEGGGGGRRRPYSATYNTSDERFNNNYDPRGPPPDHSTDGNNWRHEQDYQKQQQYNQQYEYQGAPPPNFRGGRGGGRGGSGGQRGGRPSSSSDQYNQQRGRYHHQQQRNNDPQQPLPPDQRRTLVLANVPPHMKHYHIKSHFLQNWGIPVNYALIEKHSGLAYVRFETVDDAKRVWAMGTNGLDGPNYHNGDDGGEQSSSLLAEGIVLQEVYFTNFVPNANDRNKYDDAQSSSEMMSRKHGRGEDDYGNRERGGGGGFSHGHPDERDSKMARQDYSQNYPTQQQQRGGSNAKPPASYQTNLSNNSYKRTTTEQKHPQLTPEEIELKKQKQLEYQKQYEAFQKQEQEWRQRRNAEYQAFATAKNERTSQISTLQQKKELQSKQEIMLAKQLPLHKKMLSMLKSKNAPASEQSKKMKEILGAQTQLLQLKKDMKNTVEELEKLKEEERVKGVFVPSEKRPVFVASGDSAAAGVQKRSLDRRSTVLKVEGFGEEEFDEETMKAELKEHFSMYGAVSDVTLEREDNNIEGGNDVPTRLFAIVHFTTRLDAEKAKDSGANFKETSLKCSWHHDTSSSTPNDGNDAEGGDTVDSVGDGPEESNYHDDIYGDDQVEESYGEYFAESGLPAGEEHDMVDYDYGGDEDMVDYD